MNWVHYVALSNQLAHQSWFCFAKYSGTDFSKDLCSSKMDELLDKNKCFFEYENVLPWVQLIQGKVKQSAEALEIWSCTYCGKRMRFKDSAFMHDIQFYDWRKDVFIYMLHTIHIYRLTSWLVESVEAIAVDALLQNNTFLGLVQFCVCHEIKPPLLKKIKDLSVSENTSKINHMCLPNYAEINIVMLSFCFFFVFGLWSSIYLDWLTILWFWWW